MKIALTSEQSREAEKLLAIGERRFKQAPTILGQLLRASFPDEPHWHIHAIPVSQSTAAKIRQLLEREQAKLGKNPASAESKPKDHG